MAALPTDPASSDMSALLPRFLRSPPLAHSPRAFDLRLWGSRIDWLAITLSKIGFHLIPQVIDCVYVHRVYVFGPIFSKTFFYYFHHMAVYKIYMIKASVFETLIVTWRGYNHLSFLQTFSRAVADHEIYHG